MNKHFCLNVAVALLLLFAQQAALAHSIDHVFVQTSGSTEQHGQPSEQLCERCLAHAQLAAAAVGGCALTVPCAPPGWALIVGHGRPHAEVLVGFSARAPPLFP